LPIVSHILGVTTMRVRFIAMMLGLTLCGCATINDYQYTLTQRFRADCAYRGNYGIWSRNSWDYHDGWKQGYFDLSTGQCDEPPATPPHKYWNPRYQSLDGKAAVDQWYSGWQDGATAAIQDGRPYFHPVVSSPTAQANNCGPHAFHGGDGMESLPPASPTHDMQPQVHVGPAPEKFTSQSLPGERQLQEEDDERPALPPQGNPAFDPPPVDLGERAAGSLNDYYSDGGSEELIEADE
jgi:hypothetical protein